MWSGRRSGKSPAGEWPTGVRPDETEGMECGLVAFPTETEEAVEMADKMVHLRGCWAKGVQRWIEGGRGGGVGKWREAPSSLLG